MIRSRLVTPASADYPAALARRYEGDAARAPSLYLRGELPRQKIVAIVGTREPSPGGAAFARWLARELVEAGYAVASGGAVGIDRQAHEGALEASGATVVCAPSGLSRPYPPEHDELFERIGARGGALLSMLPDDARASRGSFHQRNLLLAVLADALVVVEAGLESGARSAAGAARRVGTPLGVVPGAPWAERGAGCAAELAAGLARPVVSLDDVRALCDGEAPAPRSRRARPRREASLTLPLAGSGRARSRRDEASSAGPIVEALLDPPLATSPSLAAARSGPELAVLVALAARPLHVDELAARAGLSLPELADVVLGLTLDGALRERAPGVLELAPAAGPPR
jgi:DNA processing protein